MSRTLRGRAASTPGLSFRAAVLAAGWLVLVVAGTGDAGAAAARDPLAGPGKRVLATTTMSAGSGLSVTLTEFLTGERSERSAVNILLGLYRTGGEQHKLVDSRDYNTANGGFVSRGSLEIVDLDGDEANEVLVKYRHKERPNETRMIMDLFKVVDDHLVLCWTGPVGIDTTDPSLRVEPVDRERFVRDIDYVRTASARGDKIFFHKTVSVAAGTAFDPPRVLPEEFALTGTGKGLSAPADTGR